MTLSTLSARVFLPSKCRLKAACPPALTLGTALPRSVSVTRVCTHRFSEVKEHNGFYALCKAREAEKAMEAAA